MCLSWKHAGVGDDGRLVKYLFAPLVWAFESFFMAVCTVEKLHGAASVNLHRVCQYLINLTRPQIQLAAVQHNNTLKP